MRRWDVGGPDKIRPLWRHYFHNTQAVIFVIDSNDRERLPECHNELERFVAEPELRGTPILFFANKQDMPNAMSVEEISEGLGLPGILRPGMGGGPPRAWYIRPSTIHPPVGGTDGLYEGLQWLKENVAV